MSTEGAEFVAELLLNRDRNQKVPVPLFNLEAYNDGTVFVSVVDLGTGSYAARSPSFISRPTPCLIRRPDRVTS